MIYEEMIDEKMIDEKMNKMIAEYAINYARTLILYGVDISDKYETATAMTAALDKAYLRGKADGLKRAYEMRQKDNGWIPCSESLPKKPEFGEDSYLVQSKIVKTPYTAYWDGEKWSDVLDEKIFDVIAYMPLPEPYKEGLK
jgi:hypothetical protein